MFKKLIVMLLSAGLMTTPTLAAEAVSEDKPIQMYVNEVKVAGVHPIMRSGIMYVPYRQFFDAMGYEIVYNPQTRQISGVMKGAELQFSAGEDIIEYNGITYKLDQALPVINGRVYLPLRFIGNFAKYSVNYDKTKLTVSLKSYGYGQEAAIQDLLTRYYETFSPRLLTSDNLTLGYKNLEYDYEANQPASEIPVRDFKVKIDQLEYFSAGEATIRVTYLKNTEVLNREDVYDFHIRYERGQWKIAEEDWIYNRMELPDPITTKAAVLMEKHNLEQSAVLSDLRTYYNAYNAENLDLTVQYHDPSVIKRWNDVVFGAVTWDEMMKGHFANSDSRYSLFDERVVYLGDQEAVVHGKLHWSDATYNDGAAEDIYEALIYLKYANGHWTYSSDISLDQDFDGR